MLWPIYDWRKSPRYEYEPKWPQSWSEHFEEELNLLPLLGIMLHFHSHPIHFTNYIILAHTQTVLINIFAVFKK
jgi:hypothetical protein